MNQSLLGQTLLALLLFAILGLLLWKNHQTGSATAPREPAQFDQRFTDFSARQFTDEGTLNWLMTGARLDHLTEDRGYTARDLDLLLYTPRQSATPPWHIHAETGTADEKLSEIQLHGHVVGVRAPYQAQGELQFRTTALTLWPKTDRAESSATTTFSEQNPTGGTRWQSTAQGFTLDYQKQELTQSQITDRYNPPRAVPGATP